MNFATKTNKQQQQQQTVQVMHASTLM